MKLFLSTPISAFNDTDKLKRYRDDLMRLIEALKINNFVYSEIESVVDASDYDSPEESISMDLNAIKECDIFILHYPKKMPTSALVELGFAIAYNKRIIIIVPQKNILPYLINGISAVNSNSLILESESINDFLIQKIVSLL